MTRPRSTATFVRLRQPRSATWPALVGGELVGLHAHRVVVDAGDVHHGVGDDASHSILRRCLGRGLKRSWIWNCDPPRNSMPKLNPPSSTGMRDGTRWTITTAIVYQILRLPTKVERASAGVEVVSEPCEAAGGHQESFPSFDRSVLLPEFAETSSAAFPLRDRSAVVRLLCCSRQALPALTAADGARKTAPLPGRPRPGRPGSRSAPRASAVEELPSSASS